jgi:hypothetical protein
MANDLESLHSLSKENILPNWSLLSADIFAKDLNKTGADGDAQISPGQGLGIQTGFHIFDIAPSRAIFGMMQSPRFISYPVNWVEHKAEQVGHTAVDFAEGFGALFTATAIADSVLNNGKFPITKFAFKSTKGAVNLTVQGFEYALPKAWKGIEYVAPKVWKGIETYAPVVWKKVEKYAPQAWNKVETYAPKAWNVVAPWIKENKIAAGAIGATTLGIVAYESLSTHKH